MSRRLRTYRSYLVPVLVSIGLGVSTATAACVVVIQVQCQPTCGAEPKAGAAAALGADGSTPSDPVPSAEPSTKDPSSQTPSSDTPGTNYSASGQQETSPDPEPSDPPSDPASDPAAAAVLASLDALRQQKASCPDPLVVDQMLQSVAAGQAEALEKALPDRPSNRTDSAVDRVRAAGFTGRVVEIVTRGADTTKDLTAALSVGRYGRMALDCSLTNAGIGVGNGVVVIELGATT